MKLTSPTIVALSVLATQAQLLPFSSWLKPNNARLAPPSSRQHQQEAIMNPGIQLPNEPSKPDAPSTAGGNEGDSTVILSDVISSQRIINIFAGFTRDISSVSSRLDTTSQNTTVLAPLNSAISDLPRKPWEDPQDYAALGANAYSGEDGEDRAHRNLRRFAESHVVPVSPWKEGEKVKTMGGNTVWWESKKGSAVVQPGNVEVERVASKVKNGEVWVLKGVLNYAE